MNICVCSRRISHTMQDGTLCLVVLTLNTVNVQTPDWVWTTSFTFAHNKNAIRSLYGRKEDVVNEARFIGKPINVIYHYQVDGVYSYDEWAAMTPEQRTLMGADRPGYARASVTSVGSRIRHHDLAEW